MSAFAAVLPISRRLHQDGFLRPGPLSLRASIVEAPFDMVIREIKMSAAHWWAAGLCPVKNPSLF